MTEKYPGVYLREIFRGKNRSVALLILNKGAFYPLHKHLSSEEAYLVLKGSFELKIEGQRKLVDSFEKISIKPNVAHGISSVLRKTVMFVTSCPAFQNEDTIYL